MTIVNLRKKAKVSAKALLIYYLATAPKTMDELRSFASNYLELEEEELQKILENLKYRHIVKVVDDVVELSNFENFVGEKLGEEENEYLKSKLVHKYVLSDVLLFLILFFSQSVNIYNIGDFKMFLAVYAFLRLTSLDRRIEDELLRLDVKARLFVAQLLENLGKFAERAEKKAKEAKEKAVLKLEDLFYKVPKTS
jgi:hypothetical protein